MKIVNDEKQNPLTKLLVQEQKKLAGNIYRLASLYTPYGRIPDLADFENMSNRIPNLVSNDKAYKPLWPSAGDKLTESVQTALTYAKEQFEAVEELIASGAENTLSTEDLFNHALSNDFNHRRMVSQTERAA